MISVIRRRRFALLFAALLFAFSSLALIGNLSRLSAQDVAGEDGEAPLSNSMRALVEDKMPAQPLEAMSATPCVAGIAGIYPCKGVDLLSFIPLSAFGASSGNDSWGWTDPSDGTEYALMGLNDGTAFVDLSDPENPVYLGKLPAYSSNSSWRDIKVYDNHAFVVSEASGHGMQVFDLTELRNVVTPPATFTATAHFDGFSSAHNIVINEESGYAYAVGSNTCSGGLHFVDITIPTAPSDAGCFSSDGYTHDAQCVNYNGPDADHQGSEICINANEDTVTIVDVTNKTSPSQLSRTGYSGSAYTHQGWLTEDHSYYIQNDELDEQNSGHNTRTRVWDVTDLDSPTLVDYHDGRTPAIDHNLYVHNGIVFEANYRSGMSMLEIGDLSTAELTEVGYFDIYPSNDNASFNGAWNVYPFFESGTVIVSGIEQGLFVLRPNISTELEISKSQPEGIIEAGNWITYTIVVTNIGSITATDVVVTDTMNGVPVATSTPTNIGSGAFVEYLFLFWISDDECDTTLANMASVSGSNAPEVDIGLPIENEVNCTYLTFTPLLQSPP